MPTYSARCSKCGSEKDYIRKVDDRNDAPTCCKEQMARFITPTMVCQIGLSDAFSTPSPIDGKMIYGRDAYLKELKKGKVLPESELRGEAEHRKKALAVEEKAKINSTIRKVIATNGG